MIGIIGKKLGMTQLFNDAGQQIPCTVIEAEPCPVVQVKTADAHGYDAVQIAYDKVADRKLTRRIDERSASAAIDMHHQQRVLTRQTGQRIRARHPAARPQHQMLPRAVTQWAPR